MPIFVIGQKRQEKLETTGCEGKTCERGDISNCVQKDFLGVIWNPRRHARGQGLEALL
jgi:hypothetical protein